MPGNPWIREDTFRHFVRNEPGPKMSVDGTVTKILFLMGCLAVGVFLGTNFPHAALTARLMHPTLPWSLQTAVSVTSFFWPGFLAVLLAVLGFIAWHFERAQPYLAPLFAVMEGMCMSSLALASNAQYPGLGLMALAATCALLLLIALAYWLGLVSEDLGPFSVAATAVFVTLIAGFAVILTMRSMGADITITGHATLVYWAIVLGFVVFLTWELALAFRYIADAAELGAPKWMEWRAAFGLMVMLVWIYVVMLDVLRIVLRETRSARNSLAAGSTAR